MKNDWHNNLISKMLDEKYPHDFSICDIDGVCRVFYKINNEWKTRLIIYESKMINEPISQTQMQTLYQINKNINWSSFDKQSGLYVIKHDENIINLDIYNIIEVIGYGMPLFELKLIKSITMDDFYNWISATDKRNKKYFKLL